MDLSHGSSLTILAKSITKPVSVLAEIMAFGKPILLAQFMA